MKNRSRALQIFIIGGILFASLSWYMFEVPLVKAGLVGFCSMGMIAAADFWVPQKNVWVHGLFSLLAGLLLGLAIWWLVPWDISWYYFSIPCAILVLAEAMFERLGERWQKKNVGQ